MMERAELPVVRKRTFYGRSVMPVRLQLSVGARLSAAAKMSSSWLEQRHFCHIIVMVMRAKLTEIPAPNFGPRTTKITPFAFRNRAMPIPPTMAPPAPTAI
jgi:hypothetical protein